MGGRGRRWRHRHVHRHGARRGGRPSAVLHDARALPRDDGSRARARGGGGVARWPLAASLIIHRIGELRPGDNIVLVVTASAHRQAAFEAAAFLMDYLKTRAPFWKKETGADGTGRWVEARDSDTDALVRWADRDARPGKAAE